MPDKIQIIGLPVLLLNPVYVSGLTSPLEEVAQILEEQNKSEYALALRNAAIICDVFSKVCLDKTHVLYENNN